MSKTKRAIIDELYKTPRINFKRRRTKILGIDELWQIDLADVQAISKQNEGFRYLFCIIDCFSKFAFVIPIKTKTAKEVTSSFEKLLEQSKRKPKLICSDFGKEFHNTNFQALLKKKDIRLYSTHSIKKAAIVER